VRAGRRFSNPWPGSEPHRGSDVLRFLLSREPGPVGVPPGGFPVAVPVIAYPRAGPAEFFVTWIGHSSALLQFAGRNLLTDPMFSRRASPVQWGGPRRMMGPGVAIEALPPLDIILISHNHYDHLDKASVKLIARTHRQATWVVPLRLGSLLRKWGVGKVVELGWWAQAELDGLRVTATPANHFSSRSFGDRNRSLWCGYAIEGEVRRAWFAGDTAYHPEFGAIGSRLGPFDFVMIPIGAYEPRWFMGRVHVNPEEAVRIYQDVAGPPGAGRRLPLMLGIHWGTFRLTDEPMDEPPARTLACWRELGLAEDRLWIARFGETRLVNDSGLSGR
jgi:N-acyl-phosphatidylethanolamine-hydrolysing phospholipase D